MQYPCASQMRDYSLGEGEEEDSQMYDTYEKRDRLSQYKKMNINTLTSNADSGFDENRDTNGSFKETEEDDACQI